MKFPGLLLSGGIVAAVLALSTSGAMAQEVAPATETSVFVFNSLLFLISGMVVMFMAAGFCMLEVGMVRSKNAATICLKNISLYSVAGLMVWLFGYDFIYGLGDNSFITSDPFLWMSDDQGSAVEQVAVGYAAHSDWYFQMVFVATAASIVSGTLAERIKLFPFLIFTALLTGFIYPIQAAWEWGGGWLDNMDFSDFAGSTLVHSTGGWAALAGAIVLGPRLGKYVGDKTNAMPGSNLPLATLGTFILWLGWFGFNGGSQLAAGTAEDIISVATIFVNTNTAAAAGVVAAMTVSYFLYKKVDLTLALNGAIGGLVSITAEPLTPMIWQAAFIGAVGGVLVCLAVPLLDKLKIDDVVGAIPAHLVCGIWGTLIVPMTNDSAPILAQVVGVVSIGAFVFIVSFLVWTLLKYTLGIRASEADEQVGLDKAELGLEAYPEFRAG